MWHSVNIQLPTCHLENDWSEIKKSVPVLCRHSSGHICVCVLYKTEYCLCWQTLDSECWDVTNQVAYWCYIPDFNKDSIYD